MEDDAIATTLLPVVETFGAPQACNAVRYPDV